MQNVGMSTNHLRLVVPKGRMETQLVQVLNENGFFLEKESDRSLMFSDTANQIDLLPLKSQDILTFLECGFADYGIIGRDVFNEQSLNLQTIAALPLGICRMSLAGYPDYKLSEKQFLRIATKYPQQAKEVLKKLGMAGDIITLTSSVELAPIMGISDGILDIVETGSTLVANGLVEWFTTEKIQALLIKNPVIQRTEPPIIARLLSALQSFDQ